MKAVLLVAFLAFALIASIEATKYGDSCTHTGDAAKDDAACVGVNNNMLCNTKNLCHCIDEYKNTNGVKYAPAADNLSCVTA